MSLDWSVIKQRKGFYVTSYRVSLFLLLCSLILSSVFIVLIFYIYLREPEPGYYATNGVTPLVQLRALPAPNNSSAALLAPDPPALAEEKEIPK